MVFKISYYNYIRYQSTRRRWQHAITRGRGEWAEGCHRGVDPARRGHLRTKRRQDGASPFCRGSRIDRTPSREFSTFLRFVKTFHVIVDSGCNFVSFFSQFWFWTKPVLYCQGRPGPRLFTTVPTRTEMTAPNFWYVIKMWTCNVIIDPLQLFC